MSVAREEEVFAEAIQIASPEQRAAYLDQACGGDEQLRSAVQSLLDAYENPDSLFAAAPGAMAAAAAGQVAGTLEEPMRECVGMQIGPYKLLQQLGEGGMGTVFLAQQSKPVDRMVALKVIKPGMDSRQVIARFEAERQALALMDHPNIARVLDAGTTDSGRPYFVMELVKGMPITKYCDHHRLSPRDRLELFLPVCHAVQHAHQKGIIHRDVKPSNVLVALYDGKPVPKVIDFGVAKATGSRLTERTLFTAIGAVVGTFEYMSPEQAELNQLDVDTRTDIYSLGVLLYELLTGSTPLDHRRLREMALLELLRAIREVDPPKPSTRISESGESLPSICAVRHIEPKKLGKMLRGELDWIVMKSLEKDRTRRYETASGFAMDVNRYLEGEAVLASPPSATYRFRKFARRNRVAITTATLVAAALVLGTATSTWQAIRAETARKAERQQRLDADAARLAEAEYRKAADEARAEEAAQRQIAEAEKKKAEQAEADTLADYRASTDEAIEQLIGSKTQLGPQERAYLEKTLKRWQTFAARQGDDEHSLAIRAEGHFRVAYLWGWLGQSDKALIENETARDLFHTLTVKYPAVPKYRQNLASAHINLGIGLYKRRRYEEACTEYERARELLATLAAEFPSESIYQHDLARSYDSMGVLLMELGESDRARIEFESASGLLTRLVTVFPENPLYRHSLAHTHDNLGSLLAGLGQSDAARVEFESASKLLAKLAVEFPTDPQYRHRLADAQINLGMLSNVLGRHDAALKEFESARGLQSKLATDFPAVIEYQHDLARSHDLMGGLLFDLGESDRARIEFESARELLTKLAVVFPADPQYRHSLGRIHNSLGGVLKTLGQNDAARAEFESARDLRRKLAHDFPDAPAYRFELAFTHGNLGLLLSGLGQFDAARTEFEEALKLQTTLSDDFPAVPKYQNGRALAHHSLGNLLVKLGQHEAALTEFEQARHLQVQLVKEFPAISDYRHDLAMTYVNSGSVLRELGRYDAARNELDKGLAMQSKLAAESPEVPDYRRLLAAFHHNLGLLLVELEQYDAARTEYENCIALQTKLAADFPDVPEFQVSLGGTYCNLGIVLFKQDHLDDSIRWYELAIRTLRPVCEQDRRALVAKSFLRNSYSNRAEAYQSDEQYTEAIQDWDHAINLSPEPEQPVYRAARAMTQFRAGQVAEAIAEVEELSKESDWLAGDWYNFACVYAAASGTFEERRKEYANRAMELLQKAVHAGFTDAEFMEKDPSFESLREREDFRKLLDAQRARRN